MGFLNVSQQKAYLNKLQINYCHIIILTGAYGPLMRLAEPSMTRRNPALDRLPASRVARGGKGELPVNQ